MDLELAETAQPAGDIGFVGMDLESAETAQPISVGTHPEFDDTAQMFLEALKESDESHDHNSSSDTFFSDLP